MTVKCLTIRLPRPTACAPPLRPPGAEPVEPHVLQPADTLLDLYGEEIRARAFVPPPTRSGAR